MKKTFIVIGIIVGAILIIASFSVPVPNREISSPERYIGGDAYNYQIEASLRAGEIAGAKATKAIYLIGGIIIFFGSFIALGFSNDSTVKNIDTLNKNFTNFVKYYYENDEDDEREESGVLSGEK